MWTWGAVRFYAVELASDPKLFDPASAALRTSATFFASWTNGLLGPVENATFAIPQEAWRALRDKAVLYYRVLSSAVGGQWQATATSTSISALETAPKIAITNDAPPSGPRSLPRPHA